MSWVASAVLLRLQDSHTSWKNKLMVVGMGGVATAIRDADALRVNCNSMPKYKLNLFNEKYDVQLVTLLELDMQGELSGRAVVREACPVELVPLPSTSTVG